MSNVFLHAHVDIVFPRFIHSINRKGLTYKVDVNHLADQTQEELRKLRGRKKTDGKYNGGMEFKSTMHPKEIPASMNWRLRGKKARSFLNKKMVYNRGVQSFCSKGLMQNNKQRAGPHTISSTVIC